MVAHATPAMLGKSLTEGYVTQPAVMAMASFWEGRIALQGMLNLEGWTLKRGELNHGVWGEGYIDRRHPHTYLHEAVASVQGATKGVAGSISAGKGFVSFGSDDPMVRPFVSYPVNHHLAQILERLMVVGAVKAGPVMVEASTFNGDEPTGPTSNGSLDHFGDSWAGRLTLAPSRHIELQGSYASVISPEQPFGGGLDQKKRSMSARFDFPVRSYRVYSLNEYARTADGHGDFEAFVFHSWLSEVSVKAHGGAISVRYENTTRPEEERRQNPFRSVRPATDNSILGTTRWQIYTASVARAMKLRALSLVPFAEISHAFAQSTDPLALVQPKEIYGSDRIWNLSAGVRINAGMKHERMGRYGAALN